MTTLHITVGDRAQLREDTLQFIQDATDSDDADDEQAVLQFGSYDDLVDNLTPLRLELTEAIAAESPDSMRAAARLVDRDVSDVHADLKRLEVLGIIELEPGGPGGALQPVVPFDTIEMNMEYPLHDDAESGSSSVSAD